MLDRPVLTQDELIAGQTVQFRVSGLDPRKRANFIYCLGLPGPSLGISLLGGRNLDLTEPYTLLGTALADDTGTARLTRRIPANAPHTIITTQVALRVGDGGIHSVKSNFITAPIIHR